MPLLNYEKCLPIYLLIHIQFVCPMDHLTVTRYYSSYLCRQQNKFSNSWYSKWWISQSEISYRPISQSESELKASHPQWLLSDHVLIAVNEFVSIWFWSEKDFEFQQKLHLKFPLDSHMFKTSSFSPAFPTADSR